MVFISYVKEDPWFPVSKTDAFKIVGKSWKMQDKGSKLLIIISCLGSRFHAWIYRRRSLYSFLSVWYIPCGVRIMTFRWVVYCTWYSINQGRSLAGSLSCVIWSGSAKHIPWFPRIPVNTLRPRRNGRRFADETFNSISWMKMLEFRLRSPWSLFLTVQFTIFHHGFR